MEQAVVHGDAVEPDDADVLGHPEAGVERCRDDPDGEQVTLRHDCRGRGRPLGEQRPPGDPAVLDRTPRGFDRGRVRVDLTDAAEPLECRVGDARRLADSVDRTAAPLGVERQGHDRHGGVTEVGEVRRSPVRGLAVVELDGDGALDVVRLDGDDGICRRRSTATAGSIRRCTRPGPRRPSGRRRSVRHRARRRGGCARGAGRHRPHPATSAMPSSVRTFTGSRKASLAQRSSITTPMTPERPRRSERARGSGPRSRARRRRRARGPSRRRRPAPHH